jgi:hypothetical protein
MGGTGTTGPELPIDLSLSLSHDILVQVAALPSANEAWMHIESAFASHSRAPVINTHIALSTTQKGSSLAAEYVAKMKTLADDMASASKKLDDEDLCSYILAGLDFEYNSLVSSIASWVELVSLSELYAQLMAFESRLELQGGGHSPSSANAASHSHGGIQRDHGGRHAGAMSGSLGPTHAASTDTGRGHGGGDYNNKLHNRFPPCQICGKTNHSVFKCFDPSNMGDNNANAGGSYSVDTNWYVDSGATDHATGQLNKRAVSDAYTSGNQIFTTSGSGMHIAHNGSFVIPTPYCDMRLNRVLHVLHASINLASIN